jgi:DNA-binding transcriptional LysR family regulator
MRRITFDLDVLRSFVTGVEIGRDFGEVTLPEVLARFSRAHPRVKIEATVARNAELEQHIASGRLDLALVWDDADRNPRGERLAELPMHWIGGTECKWPDTSGDPLPLILFEAPCLFRTIATEALDRAGISWRVSFVSPSLAGLWAAAFAGLGITLRTGLGLRPGLVALGSGRGLPSPLPTVPLMLLQAEAALTPATARLAEIIRTAVVELER